MSAFNDNPFCLLFCMACRVSFDSPKYLLHDESKQKNFKNLSDDISCLKHDIIAFSYMKKRCKTGLVYTAQLHIPFTLDA